MKVTSATEQPTRRGGQASLSLFGVGGINSKLAPHMARPNPAPARPATRKPWTSRIKGALNPGDRDGLSPAPVVTDECDGYGLARPSTPAMQRAAAESDRQDEREWRELADLAACPEWGRYADAGSIEMALAHD